MFASTLWIFCKSPHYRSSHRLYRTLVWCLSRRTFNSGQLSLWKKLLYCQVKASKKRRGRILGFGRSWLNCLILGIGASKWLSESGYLTLVPHMTTRRPGSRLENRAQQPGSRALVSTKDGRARLPHAPYYAPANWGRARQPCWQTWLMTCFVQLRRRQLRTFSADSMSRTR